MQEIVSKGVMRSGNVVLRLMLHHIFNELPLFTNRYSYRFFNIKDNLIKIIPGPYVEPTEGGGKRVLGWCEIPTEIFYPQINKNTFQLWIQNNKMIPDPCTHNQEDIPKDKLVIIPWRDPRDSILSLLRTNWSKEKIWLTNEEFPTAEYILENIENQAIEQITMFEPILKISSLHPSNKLLEIKYENFHNNFNFLFNDLEIFLNIKIPSKVKNYIIDNFNKESTIAFQNNIGPDFSHIEGVSHVHGGHVYKGDNKWKEVLTPKMLDIINPILDPYIKKWESL